MDEKVLKLIKAADQEEKKRKKRQREIQIDSVIYSRCSTHSICPADDGQREEEEKKRENWQDAEMNERKRERM